MLCLVEKRRFCETITDRFLFIFIFAFIFKLLRLNLRSFDKETTEVQTILLAVFSISFTDV